MTLKEWTRKSENEQVKAQTWLPVLQEIINLKLAGTVKACVSNVI